MFKHTKDTPQLPHISPCSPWDNQVWWRHPGWHTVTMPSDPNISTPHHHASCFQRTYHVKKNNQTTINLLQARIVYKQSDKQTDQGKTDLHQSQRSKRPHHFHLMITFIHCGLYVIPCARNNDDGDQHERKRGGPIIMISRNEAQSLRPISSF